MPAINGVDTTSFGRRVELLCDFLLNAIDEKGESKDIRLVQDLKEDAANLQFPKGFKGNVLDGLEAYMRGVPE